MPGHQIPLLTSWILRDMDAGSSQNTAIGAIGAVLGYIGAEAATPAHFERLLWPQRSHAGFGWRHVLRTALLTPGGGPVYKAALELLDNSFRYGLFRGDGLGQMLGTAFFSQSESSYTLHSQVDGHTESARNCIWERVVALTPPPKMMKRVAKDADAPAPRTPRAQVAVHHLVLSIEDMPSKLPVLDTRPESPYSFRIFAGILVSEVLGLAFAVMVAAVWHSWLAVLWVLPLSIKLLFTATALDRETLTLGAQQTEKAGAEQPEDFELHMQLKVGTFLLITGPPTLVLQYFRHFGHPHRHRTREVLQLGLVVASALLFPLGLILSVTIMPPKVQYVWISYQMYLVMAMFIARYLLISLWSSAEELIARELASQVGGGTYIWGDSKARKAVRAELQSTWHGRYGEAKAHFGALLARNN